MTSYDILKACEARRGEARRTQESFQRHVTKRAAAAAVCVQLLMCHLHRQCQRSLRVRVTDNAEISTSTCVNITRPSETLEDVR